MRKKFSELQAGIFPRRDTMGLTTPGALLPRKQGGILMREIFMLDLRLDLFDGGGTAAGDGTAGPHGTRAGGRPATGLERPGRAAQGRLCAASQVYRRVGLLATPRQRVRSTRVIGTFRRLTPRTLYPRRGKSLSFVPASSAHQPSKALKCLPLCHPIVVIVPGDFFVQAAFCWPFPRSV